MAPSRFAWLALAALALTAPDPARAQFAAPGDQLDLAIDAATRRAVIDTLCDRVTRHYVFPDRARTVAQSIRRRFAARAYDPITSAKEFADSLTAHLQDVTHDRHLRVHYRHEPLPEQQPEGPPSADELRRMREAGRRRNHGFERLERLAGNVGYLDLRQFSGDPEAQETAVAAMNWLAHTDALVVDLRRNGGGSPAMIATLLTYLTPDDDRLHINDFYQRDGDRTEQYWTASHVPGRRYTGKPVFVLIGPRTGSAAEEFAYDVQTHKLGTLVGATSVGAAHPGGMFRLNDHFAAFIATGRAINPVTKTNWEGVGVRPDVEAKPAEALRVAHVAALEKLLAAAGDDADRAEMLKRAIEEAKQRADEPEQDFVRPVRRRTG
jgi:hypothetical protein